MDFKTNTKRYKCDMRILSPIHIGSGKNYTQSELVPCKDGNNKISRCRINIEKYLSNFPEKFQDTFIERVLTPTSQKKGFGEEYEFQNLLKKFDKEFNKNSKITKFKRYYLETDLDGINDNIKKIPTRIDEHIKTFDEFFVPGSSVKGSIKAAILHKAITDSILKKEITMNDNKKSILDISKLLDGFFSYSVAKNNNSYYNISRFLHVSDSTTIKKPKLYNITKLSVSKDKNPKSRNNNTNYLKTGVDVDLETIPAKNILYFYISTNYDSEVYKKLSIDSKKELISIETIKSSIYEFSKDLIDTERHILKYDNDELNKLNNVDISQLKSFYSEIEKKNNEESPLLKIGSGSGFMATTLAMRIKKTDKNLFKEIVKKAVKEYDENFPKSRSIVTNLNMPLGWVKLKFEKVN
ncbi:type III-A CRISPR-associated RAMP protein Csm5 [Methanobrevibacter curvatus]|uniref:CRISPR system Cms protein Csm5 n=1 Tax=Methanobrevibacter curvatus TaxID=49547 RepID=A0A166ANK7_9EURY|nr:type III-A CRISPR-associated RAMP protein Csm5 [Methanobrevibacter curvatus]KZX12269.1 RAMP superfamily protein [Methanobrevibacter curvatus]